MGTPLTSTSLRPVATALLPCLGHTAACPTPIAALPFTCTSAEPSTIEPPWPVVLPTYPAERLIGHLRGAGRRGRAPPLAALRSSKLRRSGARRRARRAPEGTRAA